MLIRPNFKRRSPGNSSLVNRWPFSAPYHDFHTGTRYLIHYDINPPRSRRIDLPIRRTYDRYFIVRGDGVDEVNETRVGMNSVSDETEVHQRDFSVGQQIVERENRRESYLEHCVPEETIQQQAAP